MLYLNLAIAGLIAGAAYSMTATGLVVVYKGSGVINFAQGAIGMLGAYVYADWVNAGKNELIGVALGILTSTVVGLLSYFLVMRGLQRYPALVKMVASFGILLVLQGLGELRWGTNFVYTRYLIPNSVISVHGAEIETPTILAVGIAVGVAIVIAIGFKRTTIGRAMEASSISELSAQRLGYRVGVLGATAWGVGSALAGLAGILIAPNIPLTETVLTLILVQAIAGALAGGFRSISITVIACFAIGGIQSILTGVVTSAGWSNSVPFFLIVLLLIVRGKGVVPREDAISEKLPAAPRPPLGWKRLVVVSAAAIAVPLLFNDFWRSQYLVGLATCFITLSVVLLTGYLGQISLVQWSVAGVGTFVSTILAAHHGWPMLPAVAVGALACIPVGLIVGLPALRVRGLQLAILTLGGAVAIQTLLIADVFGVSFLTAPAPDFFGLGLTELDFIWVCTGLLAVCSLLMILFRRSVAGERAIAVRSSERAALASGIRVRLVKLSVFSAASVLAGFGGGLWAFATRSSLEASTFDPITSVTMVVIVFMQGVGTISGGIAAGLAIALGPIFFSNILHVSGVATFTVVGGLGVIFVTNRHPDGALVRSHRTGSAHSGGRIRNLLSGIGSPRLASFAGFTASREGANGFVDTEGGELVRSSQSGSGHANARIRNVLRSMTPSRWASPVGAGAAQGAANGAVETLSEEELNGGEADYTPLTPRE